MDLSPQIKDKAVQSLIRDLRALVEEARGQVARAVNAGMTMLYWRMGKRIRKDILDSRRAKYAEHIVCSLSGQLTQDYGDGFSEKSLRRMIQFAEVFPDEQIVASVMRQLSWTHFLELIPLKDPLQRDFYAEICRIERWSVRTLRQKIAGMLFERSALSKKPSKLAALELKALREEDKLTSDLVFRDPYFLDFLGLKNAYREKDLESAILRDMEAVILELGQGFAFMARQKRIQIGPDDFYLDLLFYNRGLRRLVAVELKLERFKPEDMGQMELYLRWLDRHERRDDEGTPLGLILCESKPDEQIELLQLDKKGIRVASYLTELPPREVLEQKLHEAVAAARARLRRVPRRSRS